MSPVDKELWWEIDRSGLKIDDRTNELLNSDGIVEQAVGCIRVALIAQGLDPNTYDLSKEEIDEG